MRKIAAIQLEKSAMVSTATERLMRALMRCNRSTFFEALMTVPVEVFSTAWDLAAPVGLRACTKPDKPIGFALPVDFIWGLPESSLEEVDGFFGADGLEAESPAEESFYKNSFNQFVL